MSDQPIKMQFHADDVLVAVRTILAWYWGDPGINDDDIKSELLRGMKLSQDFCEGRTNKFTNHDWWIFTDALGSYGSEDPRLEQLRDVAEKGWCETNPMRSKK